MRNFIRKSKYFSIFKRSLSFIFALIILSSFVSCQFFVASVNAAEIGAVESVAVTVGSLYSAVKSGEASTVVMDFFKRAVVFASEIRTNYFMPADTIDSFYDNYMLSLDSKIDSGNLVEADIGNIRYVGGVPVSFDCPTLGCYCFFCNQAIADRIDAYTGQKNISVVASIVDGYWDQEFYRIRRPNFVSMVSNPDNWRCSFDSASIGVEGSQNVDVIYSSFFDTFGEVLSEPSDVFFDTGQFAVYKVKNRDPVPVSMAVNDITRYNDFIVIGASSVYIPVNRAVQVYAFFGHLVSEADTNIYNRINSYYFYDDQFEYFTPTDGIRSSMISNEKARSLGWFNQAGVEVSNTLDMSLIFPNYGDLIAGGQIGVLDPTRGWWRARDFEDAVDLVGDAVAEAVQAGTTDVPLDIPDIVDVEDLPITDWADTADFVDTTGVVAVDDETDMPDIPDVNPTPDPDTPSGDDPDIPQLKIPVLLTLFPFCIPFDIKRSIEWFGNSGQNSSSNNNSVSEQYNTGVYNNMSSSEAEEINGNGMEPVFAIPLNIGVSGRPVLQSTVVLDLTEYGIPVLASYLKTVQIIAWIIVLGVATYRFIY